MSLVISHLSGSRSGEVESFAMDSVLIGRALESDVTFDPFEDAFVSAQHAEIRQEGQGFILYDMGSLNGTYLNGQLVRRASLKKGDEIGLGRKGPRLLFDLDASQIPARPSVVPMRVADADSTNNRSSWNDTPGQSLKTQAEFAIPELDEQIASRDWRFYFWIALVAAGIASLCLALL